MRDILKIIDEIAKANTTGGLPEEERLLIDLATYGTAGFLNGRRVPYTELFKPAYDEQQASSELQKDKLALFERARGGGKRSPTILPPAIYDRAVELELIHPGDPTWLRGSLTVGEPSNDPPRTYDNWKDFPLKIQ